jgi:hypothetical protein
MRAHQAHLLRYLARILSEREKLGADLAMQSSLAASLEAARQHFEALEKSWTSEQGIFVLALVCRSIPRVQSQQR